MSTLRLLIRPTLFTVGVCGTCFCGAAIVQHENRTNFSYVKKGPRPFVQDWMITAQKQKSDLTDKLIDLRKRVNQWKNSLTTGEKLAGGTIFINFLVLGAWRSKTLEPLMRRFFLSQTSSTKIRLSPMILSCFSHSMPLHFALNMYALYSFSNFATALLGPEQLVALYIGAGTVSSLLSLACRTALKRPYPSLGASGAILGVVAYVCVARPDAELLLFLVPVSAGNAIKALLVFDFVGLIAKWKMIDHAAHLGGALFGVWYATHGETMFYQYRRAIVDKWLKLKTRYD